MKLKSYTKKDRYGNMTSFEFYEGASVDMGDIPPMMEGIPDHPGEPKGTDTVPAWLTPGEFVMNAEATRMFEPQIEEMNNAGRAVQAAQGGTIPEYAAGGGQMPAANIDGNEFAKAAMAVGLPTDNTTLNKLVNLVNQGMSVQEAAKRIANVPQYSADGGPVYLAEGSGGFLDNLLNMFTSSPQEPVDTSKVADPDSPLRTLSNEDLVKAAQAKIAAADPNKPADQTSLAPTMQNAAYMNLIKDTEGFKNEAYLDSSGVPTIGYGFTKGVKMGDTMDKETADRRLVQEMAVADKDYNSLVDADLNPNQQAAVKSLLYNIGGPQFANSKARAALNSGDFEAFQKEAAEFRMANGKVIPGLENRRAKELSLFNTPYVPLKDAVINQINGVDMGQQSGSRGSGNYLDTGKGRARLADSMDPNQQDRDRNAPGIYAPAPVPELDNVVPVPVAELDSTAPIPSGLPSGSRGSGEYLDTGAGTSMSKDGRSTIDIPELDGISKIPMIGNPSNRSGPEADQNRVNILNKVSAGREAEAALQVLINAGYKPGDPMYDRALKARDDNAGAKEELNAFDREAVDQAAGRSELREETARRDALNLIRDQIKGNKGLGTPEGNAKAAELEVQLDRELNAQPSGSRGSGEYLDDRGNVPSENVPSVNAPPVVLEDEDMDQDAEAQKVLDNRKSYEAEDEDLNNDQQQEESVKIAKEIIADKDFPADNTTDNQTPEAATEAGKTAPPEEVGKVESFLSGIFGDLFDSGELKRMAIMYAGSRIMGGSHAGSMNFATKQYVTRVDAKVSAKKAEDKALAKEKRLDKKANRKLFNKNIFDLNVNKDVSKASIEAYRKSYDPETGTADSSLLELKVKPTPMNMDGNPELYYPKDGGPPVLGQKIKTGTKETGFTTMIVDQQGNPLKTYLMHQDKSRVKKEPEYEARVAAEGKAYTEMLDQLIKENTTPANAKTNTKESRPTGILSTVEGRNIADWAIRNDVPASQMGRIIQTAYESMKADHAKNPDRKHKNVEKFLDGAYIPAMVGNPSLFNVPGTDSPSDLREISKLSDTLVAKAKADGLGGIQGKSDNEIKDHIYKQFARDFTTGSSYEVPDPSTGGKKTVTLTEGMMKGFIEEAKKSNTSPFQLFIKQRLRQPTLIK